MHACHSDRQLETYCANTMHHQVESRRRSKYQFVLLALMYLFRVNFGNEEDNPVWSETKLHEGLKKTNSKVMPKVDRSEPLNVYFVVDLRTIDNIDVKKQTMSVKTLTSLLWKDEIHKWDPARYSNITKIFVEEDKLWTPAIYLLDSIGQSSDDNALRTIIVDYEGNADIWTLESYTVPCKLDTTKFPFDGQTCTFVFEPWFHCSSEMTLLILSKEPGLSSYQENSEWTLLQSHMSETVTEFTGVKYSQVTITLRVKRKYLYHVLYTALPEFLTSLLNITCFVLPTENGEMVSLSVSLFLALSVLMTIVNANMPETSDQVAHKCRKGEPWRISNIHQNTKRKKAFGNVN